MSSASISEIKSFFMGNVTGEKRNAAEAVGQDSFSQIFDKTSNSESGDVKLSVAEKTEGSSIQEHADLQRKSAPQSLQDKNPEAEQMVEDEMLQEAAEEAGAKLVEEVAKIYDVTVREVEEVMEAMGLNPMDLFVQENLVQLILGINNEVDVLTITTDEQLFADLKNLMSMADNLMNQMADEFGMSQEQVADLLTEFSVQLQEMGTEVPVEMLPEEAQQDPVQLEEVQQLQTDNLVEKPQVEVEAEVKSDNKYSEGNQAVDTRVVNGQNALSEANTQTTVAAAGDKASGKENAAANGEGKNPQMAGESFTSNLLNQLSQAVENAAANQEGTQTTGTQIINQITEYIRVAVNADTTELELHLTPESLGNVKVQIASKAGILTATFVTENEAVKSVLEAQMVQLKETFEQQGLKVESVEVNVEARGFERSLDQQNQGDRNLEEAEKKTTRRISLSGLEEGEDILTEDLAEGDKIVADMMRRNGNSVDFTA